MPAFCAWSGPHNWKLTNALITDGRMPHVRLLFPAVIPEQRSEVEGPLRPYIAATAINSYASGSPLALYVCPWPDGHEIRGSQPRTLSLALTVKCLRNEVVGQPSLSE